MAIKTQATERKTGAEVERSPLAKPRSNMTVTPAHSSEVTGTQQAAGNLAVQRMLSDDSILAKPIISKRGDIYEQEADRIADAVVRMLEPELLETPLNATGIPHYERSKPGVLPP